MLININNISKLIITFVFIVLCGCQAMMYGTGKDINKVQIGMTTAEVIALLGEPSSVGVDSISKTEKLFYRKMGKVTDWEPLSYEIVIKDGKVIKFGEASK